MIFFIFHCVGAQHFFFKNSLLKVCKIKKNGYLCNRYPENNLFALKETNTY